MADHGRKAGIDLPLLAAANPIDGGFHVVVDPAPRNAAQNPESVDMGVEQHLMGLQGIGALDEGAAVRQLGMSDLQLRAHAAKDRPVLAPVELEGFARLEDQGDKGSAAAGLLFDPPIRFPIANKGRHPAVRALIAKRNKVAVKPLHSPLLLAGFLGLRSQPTRKLLSKRIQLARAARNLKLRLDHLRTKIFADSISGQPRAPGYLSYRHPVPKRPATNNAQ